jgi:hypothetical protein
MTTFGDQVYQYGGVPVLSGNIPFQFGKASDGSDVKYYFVDGTNGADANTGLKPNKAKATIAAAITLVNGKIDWSISRWAPLSVIVIAPGTYAENLTSLPYGGTMVGVGHDYRDAQNGVKIKPATGSAVNVGSVINSAFYNIGFESADASRAFDATICNNNMFSNCRFSGAAESVTCVGAFYTSDAVSNRWINCEFTCAAVGMDIVYVDGGDSFSHNKLVDCRFTQHTTAALRTSANLVGPSSTVHNCTFSGSGQTLAIGIDDNSALLDCFWCGSEATDAYQGCRSLNGCYANGALEA